MYYRIRTSVSRFPSISSFPFFHCPWILVSEKGSCDDYLLRAYSIPNWLIVDVIFSSHLALLSSNPAVGAHGWNTRRIQKYVFEVWSLPLSFTHRGGRERRPSFNAFPKHSYLRARVRTWTPMSRWREVVVWTLEVFRFQWIHQMEVLSSGAIKFETLHCSSILLPS